MGRVAVVAGSERLWRLPCVRADVSAVRVDTGMTTCSRDPAGIIASTNGVVMSIRLACTSVALPSRCRLGQAPQQSGMKEHREQVGNVVEPKARHQVASGKASDCPRTGGCRPNDSIGAVPLADLQSAPVLERGNE